MLGAGSEGDGAAVLERTEQKDPTVEQSVATYRFLQRVARQLRRQLAAGLEAHGLTGSQYSVLVAIPSEGIALGRLAEEASKEPASLTGIIDRLERAGWVERRPDPSDRRVVRVHTTQAGRDLAEEVKIVHPANIHRRLTALTPAEQGQLVALLSRLQVAAGEAEVSPQAATERRG